MDKNLSAALVIGFLVVALALMALGWRARKRRQSSIGTPLPVPTVTGIAIGSFDALYVATTIAGDKLNRIAVRGLGFRARTTVAVTSDGIILPIPGESEYWIPRTDIRSIELANWTIDRVVEDGGLILVGWTLAGTDLDSYFRAEQPTGMLEALLALRGDTPTSSTGSEIT